MRTRIVRSSPVPEEIHHCTATIGPVQSPWHSQINAPMRCDHEVSERMGGCLDILSLRSHRQHAEYNVS